MFKTTFPKLLSMSSHKHTTCFILLGLKPAVAVLQIHILATKVNMSSQALCIVLCTCLAIQLPPFHCFVGSIYLKEKLDEHFPHCDLSGTQGTHAWEFRAGNCWLQGLLTARNRHGAKLYIKWQAEVNTWCSSSLLLSFRSKTVQCERAYAGFPFDKTYGFGP